LIIFYFKKDREEIARPSVGVVVLVLRRRRRRSRRLGLDAEHFAKLREEHVDGGARGEPGHCEEEVFLKVKN
jgi:hypothetical protein